MKNLMNKIRKANKGFTLVELIIVIAVIAVLSAVVAPQYIKYVERSRQGVDASVLQEVKHIVEIEVGTTENLVDSTVTVNVSAVGTAATLEGTGSFDDGTVEGHTQSAAYKNVKNACGELKFKSTAAVGEWELSIDKDTGLVTWTNQGNIDLLTKGAK